MAPHVNSFQASPHDRYLYRYSVPSYTSCSQARGNGEAPCLGTGPLIRARLVRHPGPLPLDNADTLLFALPLACFLPFPLPALHTSQVLSVPYAPTPLWSPRAA